MFNSIPPILLACLLPCQASDAIVSTAQPNPAAILAELDVHWEKQRAACRSLRCEASGTAVIPKGAYEPDNPLNDDKSFPVSHIGLVDFVGGRFRLEITDQVINFSAKRLDPEIEVITYVPGDLRFHHVSVTELRGSVYSQNQPEFCFQTNNFPVWTLRKLAPLIAHGYVQAGFIGGDRQHIVPLRSRDFDYWSQANRNGQDCFIVRSKPNAKERNQTLELWADSDDGTIVRVVRLEGPAAESSLELEYGKRESGGKRLVRWRFTSMNTAKPDQPTRYYTLQVTRLETNVAFSSADFTMEPKVGMVVRDQRKKQTYVLAESNVMQPLSESPRSSSRKSSVIWWCSSLAIVAVVALALWRFSRKWKE